ncbi:hypothetical protein B0T10DRAFT_488196 [Thelonectria olida]|uniref:Peptidase S8/S53 domain-containing protein n=1 Tax=Thelonectria olida TaxID=1576542 RepID=A0A9P8W2G0_9HYPO|nr:hypothetical protein B0T10DRAFT_488196 [Thelonectria olida]
MEPLSQTELAPRAAQNIAVVAGNLQDKWRNPWSWSPSKRKVLKNLATLSSSLQGVAFHGDKYNQEEQRNLQGEGDVLQTLLWGLELICTYPVNNLAKSGGKGNTPGRFPTLDALVAADTNAETITRIENSMEKFALESSRITQPYLSFLQSFSQAKDQAKKHAASTYDSPEMRRDMKKSKSIEDESYPRHVYETLYSVVNRYANCCCGVPIPSPNAPGRHWRRLELKANFRSTDREILFHTVFSKEGSTELGEKVKWQHLQFRVPRKKRNGPVVVIQDRKRDDSAEDSGDLTAPCHATKPKEPGDVTKVTSISEFCKFLGEDIGPVTKDIRIRDGELHVLERPVDIEVDIADESSISLADVLDKYSVDPKGKLLLAYLLAKSVWQFYDSDFMSARWSTESIQLFRGRKKEDDDGGPGVDWAPYYAFSSEQAGEGEESMERLPPGGFLHRYPRVLALGAMLYELGLKRDAVKKTDCLSPNPSAGPVGTQNLKRIINRITFTVRDGVKSEKWPDIELRDIQVLEDYRVIVTRCVSEDLFRPDLEDKGQDNPKQIPEKLPEELEEELTVEERRAILFHKIVKPLREVVQTTGWVDESGNIRRHGTEGAAARLTDGPISQGPRPAALLSDAALSTSQSLSLVSVKEAAEKWLNEIIEGPIMKAVVSAFQGAELANRRIRVAVLDTGFDPSTDFFTRQRKRRLKGWKDYVEGQPSAKQDDLSLAKDEDGHGTHVLSVLMKVAPAAEIFVARVARDESDLGNATGNVADAIAWAVQCRADIVTMSFGFDEEIYIKGERVISNAILNALSDTKERILFFAAAANDGGNREEMFPASNRNVLSIRGTDELGWAQPFNPPPDYNAMTCFMTLGLNVPGASLKKSKAQGADVCKSGTSVATPIAAGIAAMLLGYARMHEKELQELLGDDGEAKASKMWRITGMSILFRKMATEMTEKWAYLNINKFAGLSDKMRLSMMAFAVKEDK